MVINKQKQRLSVISFTKSRKWGFLPELTFSDGTMVECVPSTKLVGVELAEIISEVVIDAITKLHRIVKAHSTRKNVDDTLAICTMVHVPALYWRETDGKFPTENCQNLKAIIDRTNLKITAFNLKNSTPKRGKPSKKVYMWDCFVELKREDMRTLQDQQRIKLARLLVKYFEKGTPKSYKIWL